MGKLVQVEAQKNKNPLSDIYTSVKPIYLFCRFFGLHYATESRKLRDYIYLILYLLCASIITGYCLWCALSENENDFTFMVVKKTMSIVECSIFVILMWVLLILSFIFRKSESSAFQKLSQIDITFLQNDYHISYRKLLKNNYFLLFIALMSFILKLVTLFLSGSKGFLQKITLVSGTFIKALSKYQFVVCVLQLHIRFQKINTTIQSFYKAPSKPNVIFQPQNLKKVTNRLYILCRLHYRLANVAQQINTLFAFQLLFSLTVSLAQLLFQSYFLYYVAAGKATHFSVALILTPTVWLLDELIEIYWPVYACAITCEQANETPTILHEFRNSHFDPELETEVSK